MKQLKKSSQINLDILMSPPDHDGGAACFAYPNTCKDTYVETMSKLLNLTLSEDWSCFKYHYQVYVAVDREMAYILSTYWTTGKCHDKVIFDCNFSDPSDIRNDCKMNFNRNWSNPPNYQKDSFEAQLMYG